MSIPELDHGASVQELHAALQAAVWQLEVARAAGAPREQELAQGGRATRRKRF